MSGNEGFIGGLCNGAETAGAGNGAQGHTNNSPSISGLLKASWHVASLTGEVGRRGWLGTDLRLLSYFWAAEPAVFWPLENLRLGKGRLRAELVAQ